MKSKKLTLIILLITTLFTTSCGPAKSQEPTTLGELSIGDEVYIDDGYSDSLDYLRYIVVSKDYDGNVLLLRLYCLPDTKDMNDYLADYENSVMDHFLNTTYYNKIDENVRDLICDTNIEIVNTEQPAYSYRFDNGYHINIKTIQRKVFLLSMQELGLTETSKEYKLFEGKPLAIFKNISYLRGYRESYDGDLIDGCAYWTRTPYVLRESCFYLIGPDPSIGYTNAFDDEGVRPAFCLPKDTLIKTESNDYARRVSIVLEK